MFDDSEQEIVAGLDAERHRGLLIDGGLLRAKGNGARRRRRKPPPWR
jgi:hypothetical protein